MTDWHPQHRVSLGWPTPGTLQFQRWHKGVAFTVKFEIRIKGVFDP